MADKTTPGRTDGGDADIAAFGALLADPARCAVLRALVDGRALPASGLADEAGVTPATASSHLRKLTDAGLLEVEAHGRHRYYRLAGPHVARLVETLQQLAPTMPITSLRQSTKARAMRDARTCYDHFAGRLGVQLMGSLLERGHLTGGDGMFHPSEAGDDHLAGYGHDIDYELTMSGADFLDGFGVRIPPRRRLVRYCIDWTEQRHHLAGAVGRGLRVRLHELGWTEPAARSRAVRITGAGELGLRDAFGIEVGVTRPA